jgi:hypothetical protein
VKITCKCGTKKEKWECAKAQLERKNRKLAARVDSLLECDESCPKEPIIPVKVWTTIHDLSVRIGSDVKLLGGKTAKRNYRQEQRG